MNRSPNHRPVHGLRNVRLVGEPGPGEIGIRLGRLHDGPLDPGEVVDGAGAWLLPGFVDAHLHMGLGGEGMSQLDLSGVRSRGEFEAAIAAEHERLPAGRWLRALGWNEEWFPGDGMPDREWLQGAGDRPVVAYRVDFHACVVNEAVLGRLELAEDPPGGRIERSGDGRPTGLMVEAAAWHLVNPAVPESDLEQRREAMRLADRHFASKGIVAVGSMEYGRDLTGALAPIRDELGVRVMVTLLDREWPLDLGLAESFPGDERLRVIGCKAFVDGTLGSRSAAMLAPYPDDPGGSTGMLVELAEQGVLGEWLELVEGTGLSPSMHVIGDRALRLALDAADRLPEEARARVRFEHVQTVDRADLPRMQGRFASMQPLHRTLDAGIAESRLGADRLGNFFPIDSLRRAGARLAFGSDWPIVDCDPFEGIRAAVTPCGVGPREVIGVRDALAAYTTGARNCLGLDGGTLEPGAPADLVLLDRDPTEVDWPGGETPEVLMTIVGGRVVHEQG